MSASEVDTRIPDCKAQVRKYVLVSQPSRWSQRGDRVVVQSPVLKIDTVSVVPVKRFKGGGGEEDNSVCFLPRKDIEKDSSSVYENSRVKKTSSFVGAHGAALCDSAPDDEFQYKYGAPFWIMIGANTSKYQTTVPVINLHTFEYGTIAIDHVCWYPKFRGPNKEIWTLGGEKRILKHDRPKKFSTWSWAICQNLDGSATTTKNVEIPGKGVRMADRVELSNTERRALYEEMWHCRIHGPPTREPTPIVTPPSSPDRGDVMFMKFTDGKESVSTQNVKSSSDTKWWVGILEMVQNKKYLSGPLSDSTIHPRGPLQTSHSCILQVTRTDLGLDDPGSSLQEQTSISARFPSPQQISTRGRVSHSPELPELDGHDLMGSRILVDFARAEEVLVDDDDDEVSEDCVNNAQYISITDPNIMNGTTSIYDLHQKTKANPWHREKERTHIASLCDLQRPDCPYSSLVLYKHYHSPVSKCQLPPSPNGRLHEHCISRRCALPGRVDSCILSTMPSRNHSCCYWHEKDRVGWPIPQMEVADDRKLLEIKANDVKIIDRSALVKEFPWQINVDLGSYKSFISREYGAGFENRDTGLHSSERWR
jgi:hypothetical protein